MSWMRLLCTTYDRCGRKEEFIRPADREDGSTPPALMPVSHAEMQAQVCVTISGEGEFQRAEILPPKTSFVIPATEDAMSRTASVAPYPLDDKLHYCAGDYAAYGGGKKHCFTEYVALLEAWCGSAHGHPRARAILAYVRKGCLVRDLIAGGILHAGNGILLTEAPEDAGDTVFSRLAPKKIGGRTVRDQGDVFVVWRVNDGGADPRTWTDRSLQESWMAFDAELVAAGGLEMLVSGRGQAGALLSLVAEGSGKGASGRKKSVRKPAGKSAAGDTDAGKGSELCMVTGEVGSVIGKHPKRIRNAADGAKLISSNDSLGFTFRGRFDAPREACTVGYGTSLMAHNALRWLIARQGWKNDSQVVLAWTPGGQDVPSPCGEEIQQSLPEDDGPEDITAIDEAPVAMTAPRRDDVGMSFARSLARLMSGYEARLKDADGVAILALDSASPGRLAVTYYREQAPDEYLARLRAWQEHLAWILPVRVQDGESDGKEKGRIVRRACAPSPMTIARAVYGRRADERLLGATVSRLLPCIVDGAPVPRDLMETAVNRARGRVGLEPWEWRSVLGVACALVRGYHHPGRCPIKKEQEEYGMALEEQRASRDYLFGRLLAAAEYVERAALDAAGETRPTNAERLMQRFAAHPCSTWRILEAQQLPPYIRRLQSGSKAWAFRRYDGVVRQVMDMFAPEDFVCDRGLSGEFLLGYHCQMSDFYTSRNRNQETSSNEGENA